MEAEGRLRLDKWLVYARFCKTRAVATALISKRRVRVNRLVISKPGYHLKIGDVLTLPRGHDIVVIEVRALGDRRGPPSEAQTLYSVRSLAQ